MSGKDYLVSGKDYQGSGRDYQVSGRDYQIASSGLCLPLALLSWQLGHVAAVLQGTSARGSARGSLLQSESAFIGTSQCLNPS